MILHLGTDCAHLLVIYPLLLPFHLLHLSTLLGVMRELVAVPPPTLGILVPRSDQERKKMGRDTIHLLRLGGRLRVLGFYLEPYCSVPLV